jgi:hypothetical protein
MRAVAHIRKVRESFRPAVAAAPLRRGRSAKIEMPVGGADTLHLDFGWPGAPSHVLDADAVRDLRSGISTFGRDRAFKTFRALMPALKRDDVDWLATKLEEFLEAQGEEARRDGRGYERVRNTTRTLGA